MTWEEARNAILTFNHLLEGGELDANVTCGDIVRATRMAIEALRSKSEAEEYRTPMKITGDFVICPRCGNRLIHYLANYCEDCGQALDWSVIEE